ncbi:photosystem I P700 chlorophyll a apoprotein, partial [Trifolium medium]|nr:photosystem I P700 chlorophyll a apoprotein [Trifolium medium]
NGCLNCCNARRVASVEYRRMSVGSDERVRFTNMKLQNDDDVRTMFSIFSQHSMNGLIKLNVTLVRSVQV